MSAAYAHNLAAWSDIQDHLPRLKHEAHGNVMEIGVRGGFSTSALLAGIEEKGGHLYSVDVNPCQVFTHPQWTFIQADSIKQGQMLLDLLPKQLDLLFIDGDHTFEGCMSDLRTFGGRALKIMVHDCACPLTFPGVRVACDMYAREYGRKFVIIPGSYGLGIIG